MPDWASSVSLEHKDGTYVITQREIASTPHREQGFIVRIERRHLLDFHTQLTSKAAPSLNVCGVTLTMPVLGWRNRWIVSGATGKPIH